MNLSSPSLLTFLFLLPINGVPPKKRSKLDFFLQICITQARYADGVAADISCRHYFCFDKKME